LKYFQNLRLHFWGNGKAVPSCSLQEVCKKCLRPHLPTTSLLSAQYVCIIVYRTSCV